MACPVCPAAGWLGGWIGGYFGISPPQHSGARIFGAAITANLISITVIALKTFFNISLCVEGRFNVENIARVGIKTLILGIIYSIGVNYLLGRYVFPSDSENRQEHAQQNNGDSNCCCKNKKQEEKT